MPWRVWCGCTPLCTPTTRTTRRTGGQSREEGASTEAEPAERAVSLLAAGHAPRPQTRRPQAACRRPPAVCRRQPGGEVNADPNAALADLREAAEKLTTHRDPPVQAFAIAVLEYDAWMAAG